MAQRKPFKGSDKDCSPKLQQGAQFIGRGAFNPNTLCWHHKHHGFFWTHPNGLAIDGSTCLSQEFVNQHERK